MARPKNKIPTGLLAARVPLELIETVRREADAAGMRLGEFLAQAMEAACNERMWARARELLAQAQADLETADSDEARAILEGRIELCKEILGEDDEDEDTNIEAEFEGPLNIIAGDLPFGVKVALVETWASARLRELAARRAAEREKKAG